MLTPVAHRARTWVWPLFFGIAGTVLAFYPTLFSGFGQIQNDPWDTRFVNYILEHDYRWLVRAPGHQSLFDPPMFYPEPNTAAYSELLLGIMPFYALWRAAGLAPDTALQLWMMLVAALNFVAAYLLFRRCLRVTTLASCFGSFLFAFGSPRLNQLNHQFLLPQFFTLIAVYALYRLFEDEQGRRLPPSFWIAVFFGSVAAQIYACYQHGWSLLFWLATATIIALASREYRPHLVKPIIANRWVVLGAALAGAAAFAPLAWHYWMAARTVGFRQFWEASDMLPRFQSWFYLGAENWLYGWTASHGPFKYLSMEWEHRLGLGLVTTVVVVGSLYRERARAPVRILALSWLAVALLTSMYRGQVSPWMVIFRWLPGANGIRAVSRIGILELIPAAVGLALFVDRRPPRPTWVTTAVAIFCLLEQGRFSLSYDKESVRADVRALVPQIDRGCHSFFYSQVGNTKPAGEYNLDALWAGLDAKVATVNGYSGALPRGWEVLDESNIEGEADERRLEAGLSAWAASHKIPRSDICWLKLQSGH
jgi:hypothetical protein